MEKAIHVWIGERGHVFSRVLCLELHRFVAGSSFDLICTLRDHLFLDLSFKLLEVLEAWLVANFLFCFFNHGAE